MVQQADRPVAVPTQPRSRVLSAAATLLLLILATSGSACGEVEGLLPPVDAPNIDLTLSKTVNNAAPAEGASVTFTITVTNLGPLDATHVIAGDTLPAGLTYVSHNAAVGAFTIGNGRWNVGNLAIGASAALAITATVNAGTNGQVIVNTAGVLSSAFNDSIVENNIASASLTVSGGSSPPPPVGVVFSADWSTATGNSQNAITDGGKWIVRAGNVPSPIFTVVAGSTVGWTRTPNVGRVQQVGESAIQLERENAVPQSTTHWGRFYFRNDETGTWHQHPTAYNTVGIIQSVPFTRSGHSNGWDIGVQLMGHNYPYRSWGPVTRLANGTWYRYEWMVEYVTATTYRFWPRVYNMAGQQILGPDDFKRADFTGTGHSLQTFQAAGNVFTLVSSASLARHFGLGNEGPAGSGNTLGFYYFADVALSTSGWIGQ